MITEYTMIDDSSIFFCHKCSSKISAKNMSCPYCFADTSVFLITYYLEHCLFVKNLTYNDATFIDKFDIYEYIKTYNLVKEKRRILVQEVKITKYRGKHNVIKKIKRKNEETGKIEVEEVQTKKYNPYNSVFLVRLTIFSDTIDRFSTVRSVKYPIPISDDVVEKTVLLQSVFDKYIVFSNLDLIEQNTYNLVGIENLTISDSGVILCSSFVQKKE